MKKRKKHILIAIIGGFCFTLLFLFNFGFFIGLPYSDNGPYSGTNSEDHPSSSPSSVDDISLTVDYGGEKDTKKIDGFSLKNGKITVFDAVNKHCDIKYEVYAGDQYYITHIDGIGEGWVYSVNGYMPNEAVNHYNLKDGDEVKFEYVGTS